MKSKTKALKKGEYIPGNATPAPAKKAEKTTTVASNNHKTRNIKKEIESRSRARRQRSMLKLGMMREEIENLFKKEDNRMILVLLNGKFTIEDGTKSKKVCKRDKQHKVISTETVEIPNVLHGAAAAQKFAETQNMNILGKTTNSIWVLSNKDCVDEDVKKLNVLGRTSVTKPEKCTSETERARLKKEKSVAKKPTGNTADAKHTAKTSRKESNIKAAEMRTYYAALRKGGINARIKKYNPSLAQKIENWLKDRKAREAEKAEHNYEHRKKHRQLTSLEIKANKRARKAAKYLAAKERQKKTDEERAKLNAQSLEKHTKKPIQTELKMTA